MKKSRLTLSASALHAIPMDLRRALRHATKARIVWEDISPLARNEWICWITSAKKQDTRQRRVQRTVAELANNKRRPCCWAGCPHR